MSDLLSGALVKTLLPILVTLAKESGRLVRDQKFKIDAALSAEKLSRAIVDICTVKTMWSKDQSLPIDDFYYPSKVTMRRVKDTEIPLVSLFRGRFVIEGIVGQGKSILLRYLCRLAVDNRLIPVFIELKNVSHERSLESLIFNYLESVGILGGEYIFSYLASGGRIILVLDGFDEISKQHVSSVIYEIDSLRKKYDSLGVIVSARPYTDIQRLFGFDVYCLAGLERKDYDGFLSRLISDSHRRFNVREAIEDAPENIKGVITTPLMLTLLVMVYESESEIPSTLPGFFEKLFGTVFSRHDRLKAGFDRQHYSGLSEARLKKLFDSFCFMLMQSGGSRDINGVEFSAAFERAVRYTPDCACDIDLFRKDIVEIACLMLDDGFDLVTFLHKSIMEYHAASFVRGSSDEVACKFYDHARTRYEEWEAVLLFLSSIDEYRYGREYVLKAYSSLLSDMRDVLASKSKKDLLAFLLGILPNLRFIVKGHRMVGMDLGSTNNNDLVLRIIEMLHDTVGDTIKISDSRVLNNAIRSTPAIRKGELGIDPGVYLEIFDVSNIWSRLAEIEANFNTVLVKFEKIVSAEEQKKELFE